MFEALSRLFGQTDKSKSLPIEPQLAVAALLVHLASVDGHAKPGETEVISNALKAHYGLEDAAVKKLLAEARKRDREAVDLYEFTARLNRLESEEKTAIIAMMWQVVFADDTNHELEDNMVWRVAELIGVSARERTVLRNRARQGMDAAPEAEAGEAD